MQARKACIESPPHTEEPSGKLRHTALALAGARKGHQTPRFLGKGCKLGEVQR